MVLVPIADEPLGQNRPIKYQLVMDGDDDCDDVDWIHQVQYRN
jgi:hypothetical protein